MITVVVLTKNEEENLKKCLEVLKWADEILIIDDNSTDKTLEVAKEYKTTIYERPLNGDFTSQRNFGLEKASNTWVLFLDADEIVSPQLRAEITRITDKNPQETHENGFYIKRNDYLFGNLIKYGETANQKPLRLAKRGTGEWKNEVHEVWDVRGKIGTLTNPLKHYPHQTISEFLESINFYSTLRASQLKKEGVHSNLFSILIYPTAKFIKDLIILQGFRDKFPGFLIALMMSFHSFLVRSKLFLAWKQRD